MTVDMFRSLDFIYAPSARVEEELEYYKRVLGGEPLFSIRAFGTRVAGVKLGDGPSLLSEHLQGEAPILIYRVENFDAAVKELEKRGVKGQRLEIPHGPCFTFKAPGTHRFAIYELARSQANAHFLGRFDP
jgi:hypothetical protein